MYNVLPAWLVWLAALSVALAQPQPPHIGYVYPAGGRQGTTFDIAVGGQYLPAVSNVYFSGVGVQGVVIEHAPPLTSKEVDAMRERLQELRKFEKLPATAREIAAIRKKLDCSNGHVRTRPLPKPSPSGSRSRPMPPQAITSCAWVRPPVCRIRASSRSVN